MSAIDDQTRLQHIRDAAEKIITFTERSDRAALAKDDMLQLALVRLVEIIGEAASRLSGDFKTRHSEIPWAAIIGCVTGWYMLILRLIWMWCGIRSRSLCRIC